MQLARRFAAAAIMAESLEAKLVQGEGVDVAKHAVLSSTLVRIASRLGIERRLKDITPRLESVLETARQKAADYATVHQSTHPTSTINDAIEGELE